MSSDDPGPGRSAKARRMVNATCTVHEGTPSYTNLAVSREGNRLLLDPHVTGACRLSLTLDEARELYLAIGDLLR